MIQLNTINDTKRAKIVSEDKAKLLWYEMIKEFFVDSSGWWSDNEPALTFTQFEYRIKEYLNKGYYTAITRAWQFQVYVWVFKKVWGAKAKKLKGNTYRIETNNGYNIWFHNTIIISYNSTTWKYTLNNWGWFSKTTKERLNEFTPFTVSQKNFEWFVNWEKFYNWITL